MNEGFTNKNIFDFLKRYWFVIVAIVSLVAWGVRVEAVNERQDRDDNTFEARISSMETHVPNINIQLAEIKVTLQHIKEDINK